MIDEALDALDDDARTRVLTVFNEELINPGIINIGHPDKSGQFFTRSQPYEQGRIAPILLRHMLVRFVASGFEIFARDRHGRYVDQVAMGEAANLAESQALAEAMVRRPRSLWPVLTLA